MMKKLLLFALALGLGIVLVPNPTQRQASADDFIDLNLVNVAPASRNLFRRAEQFWESKIRGYSRNLPFNIRSQISGRFTINGSTEIVDGPGGTLGFVAPAQQTTVGTFFNAGIRERPRAIALVTVATSSPVVLDIADSGNPGAFDTVLHEFGHALGIGARWTDNGLFDPDDPTWRQGLLQTKASRDPTFPTALQYVGQHGLQGFRRQSGHHRANYVPTDQASLGHWAPDNWFFSPRNGSKTELMSPFAGPNVFTSLATINSMADYGWDVVGVNESNALGGGGQLLPIPSLPGFPKRGFGVLNRTSAVPEPTSLAFIGLGVLGLVARRKRS